MITVNFMIPGDIARLTGGYEYARQILARFPNAGINARHVVLAGGFPTGDKAVLDRALDDMKSAGEADVWLIDGLAFGCLPARRLSALGVRSVAVIHHPLAYETGLDDESRAAFKQSEMEALSTAAHIVTTSQFTRRLLLAEYGVDDRNVSVAPPGTAPASRLVPKKKEILELIAIGSVIPRKGYDVLLRALSCLTEIGWRLTIVGDMQVDKVHMDALGTLAWALGISGRVIFRGALPEPEVLAAMSMSDIFVMSSMFEGYGMALTEALARGMPIVATRTGLAADAAVIGSDALMRVEPGDIEGLRDALCHLISDEGARLRLSDAAWRSAEKLPRWESTASIVAAALCGVHAQ